MLPKVSTEAIGGWSQIWFVDEPSFSDGRLSIRMRRARRVFSASARHTILSSAWTVVRTASEHDRIATLDSSPIAITDLQLVC